MSEHNEHLKPNEHGHEHGHVHRDEHGHEHRGEAHDHDTKFTIIVNARPRELTHSELSFINVAQLAFENATINETTAYTVTYKHGPKENPEGTMVNGDSVKIKSKMIFNVTATDKS